MTLRFILISFFFVLSPAGILAHSVDHKDKGKVHAQQIERNVPADASVSVSLCVKSGSITVRGWDKNQVQARSGDVSQIELKRGDGPDQSGPATRLTVLMVDRADAHGETSDCQAFGDIELMVPTGAAVHVQTGDGAIYISQVTSVYAKSQTGDIDVEGASQSVEAVSFSSNVSIKDSSGRMALRSVGGSVTATGLRPGNSDDCFDASTISGDIEIEGVSHSQISARTVNGQVHFAGPLVRAGQYTFNTTTGDVTLTLAAESSFRLSARISENAEITSDLPLTLKIETSSVTPAKFSSLSLEFPAKPVAQAKNAQPAQPAIAGSPEVGIGVEPNVKIIKVHPAGTKGYLSRRVTAVHGTGDARINVVSFNGSLHLQEE